MTDSCHFFRRFVLAVIMAFLPAFAVPAAGQSSVWELPGLKESTRVVSLGVGNVYARETYMSELSYSGISASFNEDTWKCYSPERILGFGRSHTSVLLGYLYNRPKTGVLLNLDFEYFHSRAWRAVHTGSSDLLLGPAVMFRLGGLYNMTGSNNLATAEGYLSLGLCADYTYRFRIRNYPMALQAGMYSLLSGAAIAPEYDQPYWYMYKYGQYGRAVHFAWIGNCQAVNSQVALVCPVGRGRLWAGCSLDYLGNRLGGHVTRIANTAFTVGYVRTFELRDWRL